MNDLTLRREEEKLKRREQILDATASVVAQSGMADFSMDQVARKARLSRALLYVYFHDKQDLLIGLAERGNLQLHDRFTVIAARKTRGLKKIQDMGRAYVQFASDEPVYFEAMSHFAAHEDDSGGLRDNVRLCLESGDRVIQLLEQSLIAGVADGSLRKNIGNPALVAITLWGYMHGIILIIAHQRDMMQFKNIQSDQLIEHALSLSTLALKKA